MLENNKNDLDELNGEFEFEVENKEALDKLFYGANQEYIERQKRFAEGTYTEDDLLNHCPRFGIGTKDKIELELVEQKYFDKLASLYTNLKEIEKSHQKENGKLRVELEQEKEKNTSVVIQYEKVVDKLEEAETELEQEKEKNKDLQKQLNGAFDRGFISKDKIKKFIDEELPEEEICKSCDIYDVNGVSLKEKLEKILEA